MRQTKKKDKGAKYKPSIPQQKQYYRLANQPVLLSREAKREYTRKGLFDTHTVKLVGCQKEWPENVGCFPIERKSGYRAVKMRQVTNEKQNGFGKRKKGNPSNTGRVLACKDSTI